MRTVAIIQARMNATRLPGKVLKPILEKPLLYYVIERVKKFKEIDDFLVATSINSLDDEVEKFVKSIGIKIFRGNEDDVLDRVIKAAKEHKADIIVRITGDCPFIDPDIADEVIKFYKNNHQHYDYVNNVSTRSFPRGMDTEVISTNLLEHVETLTRNDAYAREHITWHIFQHPEKFTHAVITAKRPHNRPDIRLVVDTPEDLEFITKILEAIYPKNPDFRLSDVLEFLDKNPHLLKLIENVEQKASVGKGK